MYPRSEMLDLVVFEGRARGIIVRDLVSGRVSAHGGDAVVLATGGDSNAYYLSPNTKGWEAAPDLRAPQPGGAPPKPPLPPHPPPPPPPAGHPHTQPPP